MFDFFEMIATYIEAIGILFERVFQSLKFILDLFASNYVFITTAAPIMAPFLGGLLSVVIVILFFVTVLRLVGDFFL